MSAIYIKFVLLIIILLPDFLFVYLFRKYFELKINKIAYLTTTWISQRQHKYNKIHNFFSANLVKDEGEVSGKIVIKSKNSQFKVQIPYRAFLVRGSLVVNNTATQFHLKSKTSTGIQRNLTVRLRFFLFYLNCSAPLGYF